jgi:hypothetical protein
MTRFNLHDPVTASLLMIALSDRFPNSTHGAIPVAEQFDVLNEYLAADEELSGCARSATTGGSR